MGILRIPTLSFFSERFEPFSVIENTFLKVRRDLSSIIL